MGSYSRYVVVLAALAVLIVLITPAPDELPCTAGHKSPTLAVTLASATLPLLLELSIGPLSVLQVNRVPVVEDVWLLTCTFLC